MFRKTDKFVSMQRRYIRKWSISSGMLNLDCGCTNFLKSMSYLKTLDIWRVT